MASLLLTPFENVMVVDRMRKYIALALILVLLFDSGVHYYFFHIIRQEIRSEQMEKAGNAGEEEASAIIHVTPQNAGELQWTRSGKEFRFKGSMYDVIKKAVNGIHTYYYCMYDKKESSLLTKMERAGRARKDNARKVNLPGFIKFIDEPFFIKKPEFTIAKAVMMPSIRLLTRSLEKSTPPPRLFS